MTVTSKDAKAAEAARISQIGDFKNRMGGTFELPSSLVVKARNPGGLQAFMASGVIPNSLMPIIKKALAAGKAPDPKEFIKDGNIDPALMQAMMDLLDTVAVEVIVEPKVLPRPTDEADRLDTELYADEIPQDDKQFLLQWISGGTRDLEIFRKRSEQSLGTVAKVTGAVASAQSAAGLDPRKS